MKGNELYYFKNTKSTTKTITNLDFSTNKCVNVKIISLKANTKVVLTFLAKIYNSIEDVRRTFNTSM